MTNILVLGGAMVDSLVTPVADGYIHSSCVLADKKKIIGGVGLNMARNLSRLQNSVNMACVVGEDSDGRDIVSYLRSIKINPAVVIIIPDQPTASYIGFHRKDGEVEMAVAIKGIYKSLTREVLEPRSLTFCTFKTWVLDSSFPADTYRYLSSIVRDQQIYMTICGSDEAVNILPLLDKISGLFCNAEEIIKLAGLLGAQVIDIAEAVMVVKRAGVKNVFATNGPDGVYVAYDNVATHYRAPKAEVKCVNGAGDAFAAATMHGLQNQLCVEDAVLIGQQAAKLQIEGREEEIALLYSPKRRSSLLKA